MASVTFDKATRLYPGSTRPAVDALDLSVADGEFLVLVGPSGCGKSTSLRMLAGLEEVNDGNILIGDRNVTDVPPKDRDIAMVFQNYALYPHMNVADNMGFALKLSGVSKADRNKRVREVAKMLDLEEYLDRKPKALSGGQRQRVAMGRAIVRRPAACLMDEPLSILDAKLRVQMRADISKLQTALGVTTLYVTHDQVEAMTMGDRVAVLRKGLLQQVDNPQTLYDHPNNLFVAAFIGSPAMNLFEGHLDESDDGLWLAVGDRKLQLSESVVAAHPALRDKIGQTLGVGVRPENLHDPAIRSDHPADQRLVGTVELTEALGSDLMVHFSFPATRVLTEDVQEGVEGGSPSEHGAADSAPLVARFSPHSQIKTGDIVDIAVDVDALHFFDLSTHASIWG
ncbi:ABC transporter ATP-binding protein [Conyzicola sp.]|uniref:ABC transporter ATP-binding protein n=1 Tax=Conyzicola sp. TaxID=1969404 RepID=UPI003989D41A